jgi:hypothetical protein
VKRYRAVGLAHTALATINCLEWFHTLGLPDEDVLLVLTAEPSRWAEIERVLSLYPDRPTVWSHRHQTVGRIPRPVRGPFVRAEKWAWPLLTALRRPRLLRRTERLGITLVPESIQARAPTVLRHAERIVVDEGATAIGWSRAFPDTRWYTSYDVPQEQLWRRNTYALTRRLLADCSPLDEAWFVGNPLTDNRSMPEEAYVDLVHAAAALAGRLRYFPHPHEPPAMLDRLRGEGFDVARPAPPLELLPLDEGVPRVVTGCVSAAVTNFRLFYGEAVGAALFTTPEVRQGFYREWYDAAEAMGIEVNVRR